MDFEEAVQPVDSQGHMDGGLAVLADFAEELLHLAGGLIDVDDFARLAAGATPYMRHVARDENALPAVGV